MSTSQWEALDKAVREGALPEDAEVVKKDLRCAIAEMATYAEGIFAELAQDDAPELGEVIIFGEDLALEPESEYELDVAEADDDNLPEQLAIPEEDGAGEWDGATQVDLGLMCTAASLETVEHNPAL